MSETPDERPEGAEQPEDVAEDRVTPDPEGDSTPTDDDELADEMSEESFPGSDPPSSWAGSDSPG